MCETFGQDLDARTSNVRRLLFISISSLQRVVNISKLSRERYSYEYYKTSTKPNAVMFQLVI